MELAKDDPLMVTEVRTPFDESVGEKVRGHFKALKQVKIVELDSRYGGPFAGLKIPLPEGVRVIEDETIKIQGKDKIIDYAKANPDKQFTMSGSWATFTTGRKIAGFPCSYCGFIKTCLGAELEIKNSKPVWVIA